MTLTVLRNPVRLMVMVIASTLTVTFLAGTARADAPTANPDNKQVAEELAAVRAQSAAVFREGMLLSNPVSEDGSGPRYETGLISGSPGKLWFINSRGLLEMIAGDLNGTHVGVASLDRVSGQLSGEAAEQAFNKALKNSGLTRDTLIVIEPQDGGDWGFFPAVPLFRPTEEIMDYYAATFSPLSALDGMAQVLATNDEATITRTDTGDGTVYSLNIPQIGDATFTVTVRDGIAVRSESNLDGLGYYGVVDVLDWGSGIPSPDFPDDMLQGPDVLQHFLPALTISARHWTREVTSYAALNASNTLARRKTAPKPRDIQKAMRQEISRETERYPWRVTANSTGVAVGYQTPYGPIRYVVTWEKGKLRVR